MKRTWRNQFTINEERPLYIPEFLLHAPWEDTSWGNDVCPSFYNPELGIRVLVDYDKPEDRELPEEPKYHAYLYDAEMSMLESDPGMVVETEEALKAGLALFNPSDFIQAVVERYTSAYNAMVFFKKIWHGTVAIVILQSSSTNLLEASNYEGLLARTLGERYNVVASSLTQFEINLV